MTNRQIASCVILALCGMAFYVIPLQTEDGEIGFLSGASFMPGLATSLIFVFTALDLVFSLITRRHLSTHSRVDDKSNDVIIGDTQIKGVAIVSGLLTAYALSMLHIGYVVSSTLFLIGLMVSAGGRRPLLLITVAIAMALILYCGLRFGFGTNINAFPAF
jgi:hypothetical protein